MISSSPYRVCRSGLAIREGRKKARMSVMLWLISEASTNAGSRVTRASSASSEDEKLPNTGRMRARVPAAAPTSAAKVRPH